MRFHTQRFRHDPDNGLIGDCWRTCYACLLDLTPAEVPHFMHDMPDTAVADQRASEWLAKRGLYEFSMPFNCELTEGLAHFGQLAKGNRYLLTGTSPRGTCHVVVCKGDSVEHDPHPDGGGIVAPYDGWYWVTVLARAA